MSKRGSDPGSNPGQGTLSSVTCPARLFIKGKPAHDALRHGRCIGEVVVTAEVGIGQGTLSLCGAV